MEDALKQPGVSLVFVGSVLGIATGLLAAITSVIDLRAGEELSELGLVLGLCAVGVSLMYIILVVLRAKDRAVMCGNSLIGTCLTTAVLGFVLIAYLAASLPIEGDYQVYSGAIWLTSWFVALFLSTVLVGGVFMRLGVTKPTRRESSTPTDSDSSW